ncbi:MAG: type II toxin-antitoxin system antitoxin SocA domain-containing protein [Pseudomonadota bacterium]
MDRQEDPRAVANFILETRRLLSRTTTNLELQKLLFFSHSNYLLATGRKLVSGYFEAWAYGPVHPIAYRAFKHFGGDPIPLHAEGIDPFTKKPKVIKQLSNVEAQDTIAATVSSLAKYSAGQLVDMSHKKGGPWHYTVTNARSGGALGMRITDETILGCARRTKVVLLNEGSENESEFGADERVRHFVEEPITGYGSS